MPVIIAASSKLITRPGNVTAKVGESVSLVCSSSENEPVNWAKKESAIDLQFKPIYTSGRLADANKNQFDVICEHQCRLTIKKASNSNAGSYVCTDKAGQGPDNAIAEVTISGAYTSNT